MTGKVVGSKRRRWLRRLAFFLLGAVGGGAVVGCCSFSAGGHEGPVSNHFDGDVFLNQEETEHASVGDLLEWRFTRDPEPWVAEDNPPGPAPPAEVAAGKLRVTFIGHATTLVQLDGVNVLTDPVYSETVSPVGEIGPSRYRRPGIRFEDLPPIHAVVISHNHYDHLDLPTLKRLEAAHHPRFLVGLGNEQLLRRAGLTDVVELDWWEDVRVRNLPIHAVPARHFSGRGICDRDKTLWAGWVLRSPAGPVYFAGDTALGKHFKQIRERFGPPRLAILPIGAYLPRWFMQRVHIDPAEAVEAHRRLDARQSVAMHFGTFALGDERMEQAPADLRAAMAAAEIDAGAFWVLGFGEGRDVSPL
ncbi:MAG: MBL fold metallo-hydrolase [Polyangiaceae bacterium]